MKCKWTQWKDDGYGVDTYDTECGNAHTFIEGGVKDNLHKFCPYCGKEIEEVINADD